MIINTLYDLDFNGEMSDINDIHLRWREDGERREDHHRLRAVLLCPQVR